MNDDGGQAERKASHGVDPRTLLPQTGTTDGIGIRTPPTHLPTRPARARPAGAAQRRGPRPSPAPVFGWVGWWVGGGEGLGGLSVSVFDGVKWLGRRGCAYVYVDTWSSLWATTALYVHTYAYESTRSDVRRRRSWTGRGSARTRGAAPPRPAGSGRGSGGRVRGRPVWVQWRVVGLCCVMQGCAILHRYVRICTLCMFKMSMHLEAPEEGGGELGEACRGEQRQHLQQHQRRPIVCRWFV